MPLPVVMNVPLPEVVDKAAVPTVSLHILAKNAENVLGRLLDNVGPFVQEVRIILNDTTDRSRKVIERKLATWPTLSHDVQEVTAATHPEFYFLDAEESYLVGKALADERFAGPFLGKPLLGDWAGIRNLGWSSSCDFRLFLDADDVVEDPERLPALLLLLEDRKIDLAATKYTFGRNDKGAANSMSYRERLARNLPAIRWEGSTHEILVGGQRQVLIEDSFKVIDCKDNWGREVRVPGRCFKVLYREARLAEWRVKPRHLAYLVQECPEMMPLPWVAGKLLPFYLECSTQGEEAAWVLCMVGEMHEKAGELAEAARLYQEALRCHSSSRAAFRLCRVCFLRNDWAGCIAAHDTGMLYLSCPQVLDSGPIYAHSSKLLVAQAHFELGDKVKARQVVDEAVAGLGSAVMPLALELQAAIHKG
jgi:hypothetical protein